MFLAKATRGKNTLGLYIVTIFLVFIAMLIVGQIPLTVGIFMAGAEAGLDMTEIIARIEDNDILGIGMDLNMFLLLVLISFAVALLVLVLCVKKLHKKTVSDISTGRSSWDWGRIRFGFLVWGGILLGLEIFNLWTDPDNYTLQFDLWKFLPMLAIVLVLLPLQTTFEELFTRGYLMQGAALMTKNRLAPLIMTSVFFAALHMANPEVSKYGWQIMFVNYAVTGLLLAAIALMDDGLEIPIGMHAANNIFAALFVTFEDSALQTYAIYSLKELDIVSGTISAIVVSVVYFFICRWRYGWTDWSKLSGDIEFEEIQEEQDSTFIPRHNT